jgi:hypothetical protein
MQMTKKTQFGEAMLLQLYLEHGGFGEKIFSKA